jgi:hypothetical protein
VSNLKTPTAKKQIRVFFTRSKLPLLLLAYPVFAWLLVAESSQALTVPLNRALYVVVGLSFAFLLTVPICASRYRKRPQVLAAAFRRGLYVTFALLALILPAQGALLALALYVADPQELWVWGIFVAGGAIFGTLVLLRSGLREKPGIYVTLRALRLQLDEHPKLETLMHELSKDLQVPLPRHILLGLQPAFLTFVRTVFCPDGELEGGVLCFPLPSSSVLSILEFRALTGEALLDLHASLTEGRKEFLATTEGANDVVTNLNAGMQDWSWLPKWGLHPFLVVLRLVVVAAMRFPLYLGKEWVTFYVQEFWASRLHADLGNVVETHQTSAAEVGAIQVISALIKESSLSLGVRFHRFGQGDSGHALGEVASRIRQEHPDLRVEAHVAWPWHDPFVAWQYLQFRCRLSGVSLEWCRQMALDVSPDPPARSLFEDVAKLETKLVEIARSPFVLT